MESNSTPELVAEVERALDSDGLVEVGDFAIADMPEMPSAMRQSETSDTT